MKNVQLIDHPLVQDKLSTMRKKDTPSNEFRRLLKEIAMLMAYEVMRDLPTKEVEIETPLEVMQSKMLVDEICLVPIMRAGNGFLDGMLELMPKARVGFIGLYRDHDTLEAVEYYKKFPKQISDSHVIVVDPMLATGHSSIEAIKRVKEAGAKDIRFMALISAPEGIKNFEEAHPDVKIYTAAIDRELSDIGYILPGIGDAGDRIFGTQ